MTNDEMIVYAKRKIKECEAMVELSKSNKLDIVILRVNKEMLDFYKSVLPLIEKEKQNG